MPEDTGKPEEGTDTGETDTDVSDDDKDNSSSDSGSSNSGSSGSSGNGHSSSSGSSVQKTANVRSGDENQLVLWGVILFASVTGVASILWMRKRKESK